MLSIFSDAYWSFEYLICEIAYSIFLPFFLSWAFFFLIDVQELLLYCGYESFVRFIYCKYFLPGRGLVFILLMLPVNKQLLVIKSSLSAFFYGQCPILKTFAYSKVKIKCSCFLLSALLIAFHIQICDSYGNNFHVVESTFILQNFFWRRHYARLQFINIFISFKKYF